MIETDIEFIITKISEKVPICNRSNTKKTKLEKRSKNITINASNKVVLIY